MRSAFTMTLSALLSVLTASLARADYIGSELGPAGPTNYTVFATSTSSGLTNNSDSGFYGNIGIANPNGGVTISGGGATAIRGNVYFAGSSSTSTFNFQGSPGTFTGSVFYNQDLSAANSAAGAAYNTFTHLTSNQSLGTIGSSITINPTNPGGVNVVSLSGINLNGSTITLNGGNTPGTQFVVNVNGDVTLNGSSIVTTGGLTPTDVVLDVNGTIQTTGGGNASQINAIVIDLNGTVGLHPGEIKGELIVGGSFTSSSGAVVVPAPPSSVLLGLGGIAFVILAARSRRRPVGSGC